LFLLLPLLPLLVLLLLQLLLVHLRRRKGMREWIGWVTPSTWFVGRVAVLLLIVRRRIFFRLIHKRQSMLSLPIRRLDINETWRQLSVHEP
jgi:hypothetical protein